MGRPTPAADAGTAGRLRGLILAGLTGAALLAMAHWAIAAPTPAPAPCDPWPTVYRNGVVVQPEDLDRPT